MALALCTAVFAIAIVAHPIVRGAGYGDVAGFVLEQAGKDDVVLFHGKESKSFAFSLRARSSVPKVFLLRAEKFLVDYRIVRDWGISDRNQSEADIAATIDRLGVSLLVFQPDFWTDQPSIAALQRLVESGRFARVAEFPIWSQQPGRRTTIGVYRVDRPRAPASDVTIDVPQPGDRTSGRL